MSIDWDKPIETTEGYPAKVISRDYMRGGEVFYVVQVQSPVTHVYSGDSYLKVVHPVTGVGMGINLRNKTKKVTKWINLYSKFPGSRYYDTPEAAKAVRDGTEGWAAVVPVEIEVPCD